jgi:hypothetical protein
VNLIYVVYDILPCGVNRNEVGFVIGITKHLQTVSTNNYDSLNE